MMDRDANCKRTHYVPFYFTYMNTGMDIEFWDVYKFSYPCEYEYILKYPYPYPFTYIYLYTCLSIYLCIYIIIKYVL